MKSDPKSSTVILRLPKLSQTRMPIVWRSSLIESRIQVLLRMLGRLHPIKPLQHRLAASFLADPQRLAIMKTL